MPPQKGPPRTANRSTQQLIVPKRHNPKCCDEVGMNRNFSETSGYPIRTVSVTPYSVEARQFGTLKT